MASVSLTSPYKTISGKPWMRNSWVVFLDILGFRESIIKATDTGTADQLLAELTTALAEAKSDLAVDQETSAMYGIKEAPYAVKMFTDNVVLGFPIRDDGESEFGRMISIVGFWQYTLLKHGFFVRGGITAGPIYMDDDIAFGKGLIDAYNAESTLARDPRVVLAPPAMDLVQHHLTYYATVSVSPQNFTLLIDSDSQMFVNYLYFPIDGEEELSSEFISDIEGHKDLIIKRLKAFSEHPNIWSKYAWAGIYHNHFCDHYTELNMLKIDSTQLIQEPRLLNQLYTIKGDKLLREGIEVAKFKHLREWKVEKQPE